MGHEVKLKRRGAKQEHLKGGSGVPPLPNNSAAGRRTHYEGNAAEDDGFLDDGTLSRAARFMPWIVGTVALLVYMGTMTPGMQMGDGTELAAAAHVLGVPHPTGYPLYMMLTKLWLILTVGGEVITRTTLLNCVLMATAAGLTSVIVRDLLVVVWRTAISKPLLWLAALMGLLTAFLRFHWENAVVTEVYALQFLLTLIFVRIVQKMDLAGGPTRRGLIWLTVVFALAMAHHRLSVTLILPWLGIWIWAWRRQQSGSGVSPLSPAEPEKSSTAASKPTRTAQRRDAAATLSVSEAAPPVRMTRSLIATAVIVLLAGAALYLYIPIRASQQPPINWGNVTSASAFYHHVRGTEYLDRGLLKPGLGQEFTGDAAREYFGLQTRQILSDLALQLVPRPNSEVMVPGPMGSQKVFFLNSDHSVLYGFGLLLAAGFGIWCAWRTRFKATALILALLIGQNLAVLYIYNIADIRDYYLFPFWAIIISLPLVGPANRGLVSSPRQTRLGLYGFAAILILVAASNYPRVNRSNDLSAELISATILPDSTEIMPAGSILLTDDDSETFTTWYRQHVRGERLDVLNFAGNFVYMPWYRAFFTEQQIADYQITLASGVAHSAGEYAQQLRDAIIDKNIASHPVFTSINDPYVLTAWAQDYAIEPVDAVEITNRMFSDEPTTTVLYRISPKEPAAQ